ncbi:MAG: 60S ribosomal protein L34 [Pycnora praestabilis]|nr:MAG: 60S ribosomal protein L34 [Pycnora praestabilis]
MSSTRLTYRRRNPYNTRSNKVRVIKTPGGQLRYLHIKKKGSPPKCGDCGIKLPGVSGQSISRSGNTRNGHGIVNATELGDRYTWKKEEHLTSKRGDGRYIAQNGRLEDQSQRNSLIPALRPREYAQISRPKKTVQRAYGGSRCANCVKDRVVRAFLIEEQKIVKKVLKESQQQKKR